MGTRWYQAPEVMLGSEGGCAEPVDVWSVGCIFGEMLGSQGPLFPGKSCTDQVRRNSSRLRHSALTTLIIYILDGQYLARCLSKIFPALSRFTPPNDSSTHMSPCTQVESAAQTSIGMPRCCWSCRLHPIYSIPLCPTGVDESICRELKGKAPLGIDFSAR